MCLRSISSHASFSRGKLATGPTTQVCSAFLPVSGLMTYQWYTQTDPFFLRSCLVIHPLCAISDRLLCGAGDCLNSIILHSGNYGNTFPQRPESGPAIRDRKSTRLNSSHLG